MPMSVTRYTGLSPASTIPDDATAAELARIERDLTRPGNTLAAVRSLRGIVTFDPGLRRAWELGVSAFQHVRYDYVPPRTIKLALAEGREALLLGDRARCLQIARQLVSHDPELKQGWELGLAAFS